MAKIMDMLSAAEQNTVQPILDKAEADRKKKAQIDYMNLVKRVKHGRVFVGSATDMAGVKFIKQNLHNVACYKDKKTGLYMVYASHGWITCTFDLAEVDIRLGLAYDDRGRTKFQELNVIERRFLKQNEDESLTVVVIYEIWGIL